MSVSAQSQALLEEAAIFAFDLARGVMHCRATGDRAKAASYESDIVRVAAWMEHRQSAASDRSLAPIFRTTRKRSVWQGKPGALICHYLTRNQPDGLRIELMLWDEGMPEIRLVSGSDRREAEPYVVYADEQYTREEMPGEVTRLRELAARLLLV